MLIIQFGYSRAPAFSFPSRSLLKFFYCISYWVSSIVLILSATSTLLLTTEWMLSDCISSQIFPNIHSYKSIFIFLPYVVSMSLSISLADLVACPNSILDFPDSFYQISSFPPHFYRNIWSLIYDEVVLKNSSVWSQPNSFLFHHLLFRCL